AESVSVFVMADDLIAPNFKHTGFLDTEVVVIRFYNGAIATAEASFQEVYHIEDLRDVFGSADILTMVNVNAKARIR
ncbi:dehydrogenase, partial [Pseudomonas syringae pv. tagetis]